MNRPMRSINRRITTLLLVMAGLLTSVACSLPSIFNSVGNLGDVLEEMFRNIGDSIHFGL